MRKLMWFVIGFGGACAFCSYCYVSWILWAFLGCLLLGLGLAFCSRFAGMLAQLALVILGISLGFGWFWCQDSAYLSKARLLDQQTVPVTVTVTDFGYETDYGTAADGRITIDGRNYRVRFYLKQETKLYPGYTVTGDFYLRYTALGGSREATSHPGEGIYLLLYQRSEIYVYEREDIPARYYPAVWRKLLLEKIDGLFPENTSFFAKALLLGDRSGVDYATNTAFKLSGISHIIAVSGLHVSILFGLLYTLSFRRRWLVALIGIPGLLLFAAMVGFTPSVTRACIMQILMLLAMLAKREYDPPTALSFAVLVMLAVNPMTVTSISFQLSVGCMTGIFLFSGRMREWMEKHRWLPKGKDRRVLSRMRRGILLSASVSISASIITAPLVAVYFGTVSLVSILTNLLTLWVISFIFYGILLTLLLSFLFPGAAGLAAWVIGIPIQYVLLTAKTLAAFPLAAVYTESSYVVIWLVGVYVLLGVYLLCRHKYPVAFACCAAVSLCAALLLSWYEPLTDDLRLTVLDVGQGQCILLQSEGKTYMVDCGGDSDTEAADKAAETLLSQGIHRLDGIILTHFDADHAAGVPYLLTRIGADALFLPDIQDTSGTAEALQAQFGSGTSYVQEDVLLTFGDAQITIFASESSGEGNNCGLCVLFRREDYDILITGDRNTLGEMLLLSRAQLPELDVLIAGHHGSAYSTGDGLLAQTTPQTVIISVGASNSYGHPAPAMLERLYTYGCVIYRTDQHGTVIYRR